ncbi:hypothetical protein [Mucilaginibacter sp. L3T2-6]|uniref:hypothetical protein n=1 Tax=Mucilaginibacter sp. L3T2-6 TaxID=3062491 RepID=UPI002675A736|nr:hypothetical protein [Mucilaginibacter sp. L3T2-6]MDO3641392.1 hypothetical protein [Mucilaginibacter sp. L3T2-6]MDV6213847.1 hypothetical protein [Mucilaginibacter sp. L3T2-6]
MSLTDEEFREAYKPLPVPAAYKEATTFKDKVVFALADLGEATAEEVIRHLEKLEPAAEHKPMIAAIRQLLGQLYEHGLIAAAEKDGSPVYNLRKITSANNGEVNPDLLAPGLD